MFNAISEICWLGVLAGTIVNFVMGGLWFSVFFAKPYALALGRENAPKQKTAPLYLLGPLVCGLITTTTLAVLFKMMRIESIESAIRLGVLVGFGFLATTTTNTAINPNIPRPFLYGLVSGLFFCFSNLIVSIFLFRFI